jgi:hypothetical protein
MPIQITELNISVSVNQPGTQNNAAQQAEDYHGQSPHESMVDDCVEKIVKILNDKKER